MKIFLIIFLIFFSFNATSEVILTVDGNKTSGEDLKEAILKIMPSEQKQLHLYANIAKNKNAKAATKVGKQQVWVDAQNELCESTLFNALKLKKNWMGRLRSFGLNTDNLTYNIEISIHPDNTFFGKKYYSDTQNIVFNDQIEKKIFKSDIYNLIPGDIVKTEGWFKDTYEDTGSLVMFSGYFSKGDGKPHCLKSNKGVFGHGISLFYNEWFFKFTSIKKIDFIEN